MDDRELLELAAKAAGIEVTAIVAYGVPHRFGGGYWNPLTDDGSALLLAVRLGMEIRIDHSAKMASANTALWLDEGYCELYGDDPSAATRRAIVRAAAEIGKGVVTPNV